MLFPWNYMEPFVILTIAPEFTMYSYQVRSRPQTEWGEVLQLLSNRSRSIIQIGPAPLLADT